MGTSNKKHLIAKLFLIPWSLVSLFASAVWFHRIHDDRHFRYNPFVLEFEFGWSRLLLIVFVVVGVLLYRRSGSGFAKWARALYVVMISIAASILILDPIVARFIEPAP